MVKKTVRRKHVPQRTCVGCQRVLSKRSLIRVVRNSEGIQIDLTGKKLGRGAYLHNQRSCWEKGLKGALEKALKTKLSPAEHEVFITYANSLPQEEPVQKDKGGD